MTKREENQGRKRHIGMKERNKEKGPMTNKIRREEETNENRRRNKEKKKKRKS